MKSIFNRQDELTRRSFMNLAARSYLGVSALPLVGGGALGTGLAGIGGAFGATDPRAGKARSVIYIYLAGGMSHVDTFDTKPGTDAQGATEVLKSDTGVRVGGSLTEMSRRMNKVAVINSMKTTQGDHERGNYYMHTAYLKRGTIQHPAMGAWAARFREPLNPTMPANVLIGGGSQHPGAGFLETRCKPLPVGDPEAGLQNSKPLEGLTQSRVEQRLELARQFDRKFHGGVKHPEVRAYADLYDEAVRLMKSEDLAAFDLSAEPASVRERYSPLDGGVAAGRARDRDDLTDFGLGCLLARRLVEHGVRFVEINFGGWDTHVDNFERVPALGHSLDRGLSALLDDLDSRGMLETTLVVVATEFGRTPKLNDTDGRNHHPQAFSCLLAGGGVRGGQVWGKTDRTGQEVEEDAVTVADFNATIAFAQGLPLEEIVTSDTGRPFTVADKGKPVLGLFS